MNSHVWPGIQRSELSCCFSITFHLFRLGPSFPCSWIFVWQLRLVVRWGLGNRLFLFPSPHCQWAAPCLAFFMWVLRIYLSSESLLSWLSHLSNPFVWFLDEYCLIFLFHMLRFFLLDLTWTSECIRKKRAFALAIPSWFMNNRYWISQHFTRKRIGGLGKS